MSVAAHARSGSQWRVCWPVSRGILQSRVQGSEPLLWLLRLIRWDQICTRWSWGILCKNLVSWLRVGALEGYQGSALPGDNAFYAMCYLCFVCVCRSAWVYGVCVTILSLCLVYSVQPFFQYISVPEFPSCLLISSNYGVCDDGHLT